VLAQDIIEDCEKTLQDPSNARWSLAELLSWLNEGQRVIAKYKPNAYVKTVSHALSAGTKQALPADAIFLLDVIRNSDSVGSRSVRQTQREELDSVTPDWHSTPTAQVVQHFTYDRYDPLTFYVSPSNDGTGSLEILYAAIPTEVDDPLDAIDIPEFYRAPLVDYVLSRCFMKDAEDAANREMAAVFNNNFMQGLALLAQNEQNNPPSAG